MNYDLLHLTLNHLPDPVFIKDRKHRWLYGNQAFDALLGLTFEDYQGKSDFDLFPEEMARVFWEKDELVFSTKIPNENEEVIHNAEGEIRTLVTKKALLHTSAGEDYLLGVIRDITERKAAESKLFYSAKLASMGQLLGSIAHEINTPLMVSLANVDLQRELIEQGALAPRLLEPLKKIEVTTERMSKIVRSLKSMTRNSEHDPYTIQSLHLILQDAIELCSDKIKKFNVELVFEYDSRIQLRCNPVELSQAIINLLQNAVDAVREHPIKRVHLHTYIKENQAILEIRDSGPSIPDCVRKQMLTPFFSTKPVGEGTGLGLGLALSIIKRHQGTLELLPTSETCFRIALPLEQSPAESNVKTMQ